MKLYMRLILWLPLKGRGYTIYPVFQANWIFSSDIFEAGQVLLVDLLSTNLYNSFICHSGIPTLCLASSYLLVVIVASLPYCRMMAKLVVFVIRTSGNIGFSSTQALSSKYTDKLAGVIDPDKVDKLKALWWLRWPKEQLVKTFAGDSVLYIVTPGMENCAELAIKTAEAARVKHILVFSVLTYEITSTILGKQFDTTISKLEVLYTFICLWITILEQFSRCPP